MYPDDVATVVEALDLSGKEMVDLLIGLPMGPLETTVSEQIVKQRPQRLIGKAPVVLGDLFFAEANPSQLVGLMAVELSQEPAHRRLFAATRPTEPDTAPISKYRRERRNQASGRGVDLPLAAALFDFYRQAVRDDDQTPFLCTHHFYLYPHLKTFVKVITSCRALDIFGCDEEMQKADYANLANIEYIERAYEQWCNDPKSLEAGWRFFFEGFELGRRGIPLRRQKAGADDKESAAATPQTAKGQWQIDRLIYAYRDIGHLIADTNPLDPGNKSHAELELSNFGFSEADLDVEYGLGSLYGPPQASLREIHQILRDTYCRTIGSEYMHIQDPTQRHWLQQRLETARGRPAFPAERKMRLLRQLLRAEFFEAFVHKKFLGQKRFSLEGVEVLIPALDAVRELAPELGIVEMVIGMPHRGRLNVLANVVEKSLEEIFDEFEDNFDPKAADGAGDVKYHLGYSADYINANGKKLHISLSSNPSHLEAVDPVTVGRARGKQRRWNVDRQAVIPVLIHGDAAIAGQGLVMETLQLSQLEGYGTGGTLHIIVDNQIGFTTDPHDGRSTLYPTDIAKMFGAPVFHVNANDPEAVVFCVELCMEFRQQFGIDTFLNIVGYRKYGHNEADEPAYTQPKMYAKIRELNSVRQLYVKQLVGERVLNAESGSEGGESAVAIQEDFERQLEEALQAVRSAGYIKAEVQKLSGYWQGMQQAYSTELVPTTVSLKVLDEIVDALFRWPADFRLNPKIARQLEQKKQTYLAASQTSSSSSRGTVDWAMAEALAVGSLLVEGTPVRLSGQDSRRGTFSQRHSVLYDAVDGSTYIPLNDIHQQQAKFCVYNSPLSEAGVLGFDYGYSLVEPEMLVMWEAQFGDFANGAQLIIDQFIVSAEAKWHRSSGIVLLLPHGYEGMGPEHSSARLERFLQLCAEDNIQICNLTTPAQYFHVLRRQMKRNFRKPLIIMTPKSLLRHHLAVSPVAELSEGSFTEVIADSDADVEQVRRLLICSGKIYYDLLEVQLQSRRQDIAIIRMEQFYPWPQQPLAAILGHYRHVDAIVWVQEEPKNMGGWSFVAPRLAKLTEVPIHYIGRSAAARPATGSFAIHKAEQEELIRRCFASDLEELGE